MKNYIFASIMFAMAGGALYLGQTGKKSTYKKAAKTAAVMAGVGFISLLGNKK